MKDEERAKRVVGMRAGAAQRHTPLFPRLRAGSFAALALLPFLLSFPTATPLAAQEDATWSFEDDAFADLWFHGLATLGLHGFGAMPLYDPGYAGAIRTERVAAGLNPTPLEVRRGELLAEIRRDEAFEILHFVPLYFKGASRADALQTLADVAGTEEGVPEMSARTRLGGSVVATTLAQPRQRRILGLLVETLEAEWDQVVEPRRVRDSAKRDRNSAALEARWLQSWSPHLSGFLRAEELLGVSVLFVGALGREGRFLERDPSNAGRALVAVGLKGTDDLDGALGSVLRELCYPTVRRAFTPFERRFSDRVDASRASDLAATRCGELLLEAHAPTRVAAYRVRFGLPAKGTGPGFLSASGRMPGTAAWEGALDEALRRELKLVS